MSSIAEKKNHLRTIWKTKFPNDVVARSAASQRVFERVAAHPAFQSAGRIGLYAARKSEVDLILLWNLRPKACVFPKTLADGKLEFHPITALTDLTPGYAGILEPKATEPEVVEWQRGDLILVPGLCFDTSGNRLGSGLGFYDRFLAQLPEGVLRWGVCFDEQLSLDPLPYEATDIRMVALQTPSAYHSCRS